MWGAARPIRPSVSITASERPMLGAAATHAARISSFARRKAELFVSGTSSLRSLRALLAAFVATLGYWVMTIVTVRITPDGRTAVVISEGARSVWVLR